MRKVHEMNRRQLLSAIGIAAFLAAVAGFALLAAHAPRAGTAAHVGSITPGYNASGTPLWLLVTPPCDTPLALDYIASYGFASNAPKHSLMNEARAVSSTGQAYIIDGGIQTDEDTMAHTNQGFLAVEPMGGPCISYRNPSTVYDTPNAEGIAWITAVSGDTVTYETAAGMIGTFNYVTATFIGQEVPDPHFAGTPVPGQWPRPGVPGSYEHYPWTMTPTPTATAPATTPPPASTATAGPSPTPTAPAATTP